MGSQANGLIVSARMGFPLRSLMVGVWFLTLFVWSPAPAPSRLEVRAQPALLDLATHRPDDTIGVIVQKGVAGEGPENMVALLGGVVTQKLGIINAFAAELQAGDVPVLATSPGVRWVSLDAHVVNSDCYQCITTDRLQNVYNQVLNADRVWNGYPPIQGQNMTVAVVDSGIAPSADLNELGTGISRVRAWTANVYGETPSPADVYGHGTHVAGIIAGNGTQSNTAFVGIAPRVNLVNVKVSSAAGQSRTSDLVAGLEWILANRALHNIRVVNISLNSAIYESYHTSPLDAAVEVLWFNRIVVVVSAGNAGEGALHPPANDPFVITVGATDDRGTIRTNDDLRAPFSGYGTTPEGFAKPDLVAPGTNIVSLLSSQSSVLAAAHPNHLSGNPVPGGSPYFRMSGTSMSSPMVAGAAILLLQDEPFLTPDQVKYRLKSTARPLSQAGTGAGYPDIWVAVRGTNLNSENVGVTASSLLWTGVDPLNWNSVNWNSVNWNSVNWNSVNWNSVNWNSVNWSSDYWDE